MRLAIAAIALLVIAPAYGAPKAHSYSFTQADLNHDGYVTQAEFAYYLAHRDTAPTGQPAQGGVGGGGSGLSGGASGSIHVGLVVTGQP